MIKVSIIVPCYNVEKYVAKSINSLCTQTLNDIEIIAVNDGSTDKTLDVLNSLSKKYNNLLVINKNNEGVSVARNIGIENAKGEYIGFLDSDDWVEKDCYEKLYTKAKQHNYDIVACDTFAVYPSNNLRIHSKITDNSTPEDLMLNAYSVIWNKIYKKDLIKDIRFNKNMTFCEDVLFLYMVYSKVHTAGAVNEPLHYYLQRDGSLTYTYNDNLYHLINALDTIIEYYIQENKYDLYFSELEYSYIRYLYATFLKRLAKTKNIDKYKEGYKYVVNKVNSQFPNYKKNKYLQGIHPKKLYLKYFNYFFAKLIFIIEKNKMN